MLRVTETIRDVIQHKESRKSKGYILIWNLTNRCNLRCQHCYASASDLRDGELQTGDFKRLIPELREGGVRFAILSGGEPLMKEELFDHLEATKFSTNENVISMLALTMTLFFHLVFTMALHFLPG